MTPASAITIAVVASVLLLVISLGTRATFDDALWLFRHPVTLLRAMAAIYLVVPVFAVALCLAFDLEPAVKFAIAALAVSPLPPILPGKQVDAGGEHAYAIGLLVAASLLALVLTPLLLLAASAMLGVTASLSPLAVGRTLLITIFAPLAAGMALRRFAPAAADAVYATASRAGKVLLLAGLVVMLIAARHEIAALLGNGTILAIAATVAVGLLTGHLLAGRDPRNRASLAIAAATRHPGVAIAIAGANFADQKQSAIAAVLLFLVVNALVSIPYIRWIKREARTAEATRDEVSRAPAAARPAAGTGEA